MPRLTAALMATLLGTAPALAEPLLPPLDPAAFATPKANPWLPLETGSHLAIAGADPTSGEVTRIIVTGPGPEVLGVATTQILDEEWADGHVQERTFDLVAPDREGNLWYFGEDVTNFEYDAKGRQVAASTDASWRGGEAGALPGILVPGAPVAGQSLFIGKAPAAREMAYWEVISTDATVDGPAGHFTNVLQLRLGSPLEPDSRAMRFYAPGIGLIREEDGLSPALDNPTYVGERQP